MESEPKPIYIKGEGRFTFMRLMEKVDKGLYGLFAWRVFVPDGIVEVTVNWLDDDGDKSYRTCLTTVYRGQYYSDMLRENVEESQVLALAQEFMLECVANPPFKP